MLLAGAAAVAVLGVQAVSGAPAAQAKISSVVITGSQARPTITVHGAQLGTRPQPNPAYVPLGHPPGCPPQPTKPAAAYGLDYGVKLYLSDRTQQPAWSAGRYRPNVGELDCIGVVILKFTPGKVVFRPGAFYGEGGFRLAEGDAFTVVVNGSRFAGRVHYS
jgi:hypothetical protein